MRAIAFTIAPNGALIPTSPLRPDQPRHEPGYIVEGVPDGVAAEEVRRLLMEATILPVTGGAVSVQWSALDERARSFEGIEGAIIRGEPIPAGASS